MVIAKTFTKHGGGFLLDQHFDPWVGVFCFLVVPHITWQRQKEQKPVLFIFLLLLSHLLEIVLRLRSLPGQALANLGIESMSYYGH